MKMIQRYRNLDEDSNVSAYEIGSDFIRAQFSDGSIYLYTYASAGSSNIEQMKLFARAGDGLNAFINANVREDYAQKESDAQPCLPAVHSPPLRGVGLRRGLGQ
jgi:hypothetical protein